MNTNKNIAFEQFMQNDTCAEIYLKYAPAEIVDLVKRFPPEYVDYLSSVLRTGYMISESFAAMISHERGLFSPSEQAVSFLRRGFHALLESHDYDDKVQMEHDSILVRQLTEAFEMIKKNEIKLMERDEDRQRMQYVKNRWNITPKDCVAYGTLLQWLTHDEEVKAVDQNLDTAA